MGVHRSWPRLLRRAKLGSLLVRVCAPGAFPQVVPKGTLALGAGLMGAALNIGPTIVPLLVSTRAGAASAGIGGGGGGDRGMNDQSELNAILALAVLALAASASFGVQLMLTVSSSRAQEGTEEAEIRPAARAQSQVPGKTSAAGGYAQLAPASRVSERGTLAVCHTADEDREPSLKATS
eukprot:6454973-Prymnesium_polylepis.1